MRNNRGLNHFLRLASVAILALSAWLYFLAASKQSSGPVGNVWSFEDALSLMLFLFGVALLVFSTYRLKQKDIGED